MHLDASQLEFLARFSKSPEGYTLIKLLRAKLAEVEGKLRTQSGEELYRTQGRAVQLDELLADIATADEKLTRSASVLVKAQRRFAIMDGSAA